MQRNSNSSQQVVQQHGYCHKCCMVQVMRVAMLALRNLLANQKLELGPEMVEAGLPKVVQQRITQVCF